MRNVLLIGVLVMVCSQNCDADTVYTDGFDTAHTYWNGTTTTVAGTIWDGVLFGDSATSVNANFTNAGVLSIVMNTAFSSSNPANQPFSAATLFMNVTGNFDAMVQITASNLDELFENQGIIAFADSDNMVEVMNIRRAPGIETEFRSYNDAVATSIQSIGASSPWLRLTRTDDLFQGYYSVDGTAWIELGAGITRGDLPDTIKLGLFAASANTNGNLIAEFDNFNVSVVPTPSAVSIGIILLCLIAIRRPSHLMGSPKAM